MSSGILLVVMGGLFLLLGYMGVPVAFAIIAGVLVATAFTPISFQSMIGQLFHGIDSETLLAVPFFLLVGELMTSANVTQRMVRLAQTMVGHLRGGLAIASVLSCMVFAAISGSSVVTLTARTSTGLRASTAVTLEHSANLALNPSGTPFPRVIASPSQDRYPADLAVDGAASTFYVSWGRAAGQGPTVAAPITYGFDFGAPITAGSVVVGGRSNYGARDYDVQVSDDGRHWRTVASTLDAPKAGSTTTFTPTRTRYLRLSITRSWDAAVANVQISEVSVGA